MVDLLYRCKICKLISENKNLAEAHERIPLRGIELKIGAVYQNINSKLKEYVWGIISPDKKTIEKYFEGAFSVVTSEKPNKMHHRKYEITTFFKPLEKAKGPLFVFDNIGFFDSGENIIKNLKELTTKEYKTIKDSFQYPMQIPPIHPKDVIENLLKRRVHEGLSIFRGILPRE